MDIQRQPDTFKALSEDPVLLITNHPADSDAIVLLGSMPKRKDIFMMISNYLLRVLPAFDPHCIPVFINYRFENEKKEPLQSKLFRKIHDSDTYTKEESKLKNKESLAHAAQRIDGGGVVLMAPAFGNNDREFKTGLGHLLNSLAEPGKVKILMTHILGTSDKDYLRIIPYAKHFMPRFRILYSPPVFASEFISGDVITDTKSLEAHYYNWVKELNIQ